MAFLDNLMSGDAETLKAVGAIGGALANVYSTYESADFHEEMLDFEKDRVKKEREKDANRQAEYEAVWATNETT